MRSTKRNRHALLLCAMLPLTACTLIPSVGTDLPAEVDPSKVACEALGPLTYSSKDTPETAGGIIGHNAAWCSICRERDARCTPPT